MARAPRADPAPGRPSRGRLGLETAAVAALALAPPLGALVLGGLALARRSWRAGGWPLLWLALGLPLLAGRLAAGDWRGALSLLAAGLLGLLAAIAARAPRRAIALGLTLALAVLLLAGLGSRWLGARSWWGAAQPVGLGPAGPVERLSGGSSGASALREWTLPSGGGDLELALEVRLVEGTVGWDWVRSGEGFRLEPLSEGGEPFTRVAVPPGPDPFLYRGLDTRRSLAGRRFRARLELRSPDAEREGGRLNLVQRGGGLGASAPLALGSAWREHVLEWQAPAEALGSRLDVVLTALAGRRLDVRRVRLEEAAGGGWRGLGPLEPSGLTLYLTRPGGAGEPEAALALEPTRGWRAHRFALRRPAPSGDRLAAVAGLAPNLAVETRGVRLLAPGGPDPVPRNLRPRVGLWFGHPNLAGHSVAAAGLALLVARGPLGLSLAGLALTLGGVVLTGSRAAWLAALLGLPWLLWFACPPRARLPVYGLLLAGGALLALGPGDLGRLGALGAGDPVPRPTIWRVAWEALLEHPWTGLGSSTFALYFAARAEAPEPIPHAHNLWLDFAASYGLPGLAGVTAYTAGLLALAWRRGRFRGLALVVPVLTMNVFDPSLFFPGVACPLALGLNALPERLPRPEATGEGV